MKTPRVKYTPEQRQELNTLLDKAIAGGGYNETWQEARDKHSYQGSEKTWYQNAYRRKQDAGKGGAKAEGAVAAAAPKEKAPKVKKTRARRSRRGYDIEVRNAIVKAVQDSRNSGQAWKQAHEAAATAGYSGTLGGLVQFVRQSGKRAGRPAKDTAVAAKVVRRRGRGRGKAKAHKLASMGAGVKAVTHMLGLDGVIAAYIDSRIRAQVAEQVSSEVQTAVHGALQGLLGKMAGK